MAAADDRKSSREDSPEWHRARAENLQKNGCTKMLKNTSRSRRSSGASDSGSRQIRTANTFRGVRSGATDAHLCGPTKNLHTCESLRRPRPALCIAYG
jgi:hypothetical protein